MNSPNHNLWPITAGEGPAPVMSKVDFPALERAVLRLWDDRDVFQRSIRQREGQPDFVAYDGPPGTNGTPHIGHMMQSALKDLWPRYKTMRGYRVLRKAGWDTHGLPIELTAEKELGLKTKRDITAYGVAKYVDYCRQTVYRYKDAWEQAIRRIGRFLDINDFYATYTIDYIQTDWWVLKQAWDKGLLYKGRRIMPHCTRCGTSLSQHETAQGYRDIQDLALFVKFPVAGEENTFLVAWTTTAWTLLSNVALAVNPDLTYVTVASNGERLIFAEARLEAMKGFLGEFQIVDRHRGVEFIGKKYNALWAFQKSQNAHTVVADPYVTADDGAGIVHLALYGEDDFRLIQQHGLPMVQNVDQDGVIRPEAAPFAGRWFREEGLDVDILKDLAAKRLLLGKEKIVHSYPHCYRCDTPLMYFAKSGWFLKTSSFKEQMLAANADIKWYPDHIKDGRFGNWLANNVDWNISRERYWGSPLPIWTCNKCGHQVCVGSLEELQGLMNAPLPAGFDPHKPAIDDIVIPCEKCGDDMRREPEVLDSWFNAGIMPWGQWGYPAKPGSADAFNRQFPADFICEAIDQTRGWFYTLLAASTMLTGKSSFKNVICTELILDKAGQKMSKSRGNVVDPIGLCDRYGADAVRWNFYRTNPWTVRRFDESELPEVLKQVIIPYWNAYVFFVTYARVDGWRPDGTLPQELKSLDRWILSRLEGLRLNVETYLDNYDVTRAADGFTEFLDELTNWYIRRSRRRFWKSEDDADKAAAYFTLYTVLTNLNRMLAPLLPFITEAVYQNLELAFSPSAPDSVHLADWPGVIGNRDLPLEARMELVRRIVTIARSLRNEAGVRVRQPLKELAVAGGGTGLEDEYRELVLDELNIKSYRSVSDPGELFTYRAKPDFKALGPKFGAQVRDVASNIGNLSDCDLRTLVADGRIRMNDWVLERTDVILEQIPKDGCRVKTDGDLTISIDIQSDAALYAEWLARELIHQIQNLRKEADLQVTDRIRIACDVPAELLRAVTSHRDYIQSETLAVELTTTAPLENGCDVEVGDIKARVAISVSVKEIQDND